LSDTIKGYQALSAAGQETDLLGAKRRELISLAVAVAIRCDSCITVHTKAAIDQGAIREEIAEGGPANVGYRQLAQVPPPDLQVPVLGLTAPGGASARRWSRTGSAVGSRLRRTPRGWAGSGSSRRSTRRGTRTTP
jgi:AhpD family alkylhydroperoxidase